MTEKITPQTTDTWVNVEWVKTPKEKTYSRTEFNEEIVIEKPDRIRFGKLKNTGAHLMLMAIQPGMFLQYLV